MPDQDDFTQVTALGIISWQAGLDQIKAGNLPEANSILSEFNYEVIGFQDTVQADWQDYIIAQEKLPAVNHWGSYIVNISPCRSD